jgi:DNA-binding CsgD family transcriptional regulator
MIGSRNRRAQTSESIGCPGGFPAETGGFQDSIQCVDAMLRSERPYAREIADAMDSRALSNASDLLLAFEILDLLSIGFVVCSASGRVLGANRTAEEKIRKRDGLHLNSEGELCAKRKCRQPGRVRRRATRITPSDEFGSGDAAFAVQRPSGKRALTVLVRSFRGKSRFHQPELPAALVLIFDSSLSARTTELELKYLYGLTATEARVANMLTDGKGLPDCCRELGISRATVCTHLRRLFKKTRVRRQSELVSLLLRSVGFARLGTTALRDPDAFQFPSLTSGPGKKVKTVAGRWVVAY